MEQLVDSSEQVKTANSVDKNITSQRQTYFSLS